MYAYQSLEAMNKVCTFDGAICIAILIGESLITIDLCVLISINVLSNPCLACTLI